MLRLREVRRWFGSQPMALGAASAASAAAILGVPTGVIANPWFERKVPIRGFEVVVLVVLSLIAGVVAATYARPAAVDPGMRRAGAASGVLGWFAISCPLCNPFVVALLGTSGATGVFARVQPLLGVVAIAFAASALALRVRAVRRGTCRVPASPVASVASVGRQGGVDAHAGGAP
jgi:hypothetical protein